MTITFELPRELEQGLRQSGRELSDEAKEVYLVWLYRQDKLTQAELGKALGLSRLEIDGVLKRHNVTEDLMTVEEYDQSLQHLREITEK